MTEKKEAKLPMPSCRLCGVAAVDAAGGRIDEATGCCSLCRSLRDAFAISMVSGSAYEAHELPAESVVLAQARFVYQLADAMILARQHADLPPEGENPS